ncbi:MAG: UDP-N-acetylglucosamine 2-epimerase (non-hydrolyzing) [Deltaproteobacteria bacterium]|nr:UDP-N-acetylglucosamine 2-epimerase (non-hydrolyzing) [Deltaproteobacteria bacterium]
MREVGVERRMRVCVVFGTRPEIIKTAPVILELRRRPTVFETLAVCTGQHREMAGPYLEMFGLEPDVNMEIMQARQSLDSIVSKTIDRFGPVVEEFRPDVVVVQGDTSSAFSAALTAAQHKIAVAHVEAGLRTYSLANPFPEEMNRQLIGRLAALHFAPTNRAAENLLGERVAREAICVTGNTGIDALFEVLQSKGKKVEVVDPAGLGQEHQRLLCVTMHRRESLGEPLRNALAAFREICDRYPDVRIVFPVHLNPEVRQVVQSELGADPRISLIDPLPYDQFVGLLNRCHFVLTDSGGIQEEAPSLGKPVLVLRENTERPEAIEAGTARLVGTETAKIVGAASILLDNEDEYNLMAKAQNPFGDGTAARRIGDALWAWHCKRT